MTLATVAVPNVIVMVLPLARPLGAGAEKTTARTPLVPEPFVTSLSLVYVLAGEPLSAQDTDPEFGSIATVTIMVFPAATLPDVVNVRVVPLVSLPAPPAGVSSLTNAAAACTSGVVASSVATAKA